MELVFGKNKFCVQFTEKSYFERKTGLFPIVSRSYIELGVDQLIDGNFYYFQFFNLVFGFQRKDLSYYDKLINELNKLNENVNKHHNNKKTENIIPLKPRV